MQQLNTELDYHHQRLTLEREWRDRELELDQERRLLRRWWVGASVLLLLFSGGVAGSTYLSANWGWLAIPAGIGIIAYLVLFISYGIEPLRNSWKHQAEVVAIKNQQRILEEVWLKDLFSRTIPFTTAKRWCLKSLKSIENNRRLTGCGTSSCKWL